MWIPFGSGAGELLGTISPLRRRMQGKSCLTFTRVDQPLMAELERLTAAGYEATGGDARWKAAD